jgi:hypothetical protein
LQRGPIVFCAEWPDNPERQGSGPDSADDQALTATFEPSLLNGVETIKGQASAVSKNADGSVVKTGTGFQGHSLFCLGQSRQR